MNKTKQIEEWAGDFGKDYTDRNLFNPEELDQMYMNNFGISRSELNKEFLDGIDKGSRILEIGSNVGNQLVSLQKKGFNDLWGIEVSGYAVELSKKRTKDINIIKGSGFDTPYKDGYFDIAFTSGVLIHIHPNDLPKIMDEIYRISKRYIWGYEYFSESCKEVKYRGNEELLWKNNFRKLYQERHVDLTLVKERRIKYKDNGKEDVMFLLEKKT